METANTRPLHLFTPTGKTQIQVQVLREVSVHDAVCLRTTYRKRNDKPLDIVFSRVCVRGQIQVLLGLVEENVQKHVRILQTAAPATTAEPPEYLPLLWPWPTVVYFRNLHDRGQDQFHPENDTEALCGAEAGPDSPARKKLPKTTWYLMVERNDTSAHAEGDHHFPTRLQPPATQRGTAT